MTLSVGEIFPEKVFIVTREKLREYAQASGDHNPIHLDEEFAKSVGLPNVIAHGMYTMALAGEAVRGWVGKNGQFVEFSTRFTKPVVVPASTEVAISFTGIVADSDGETTVIEVNAICDGVKVLGQTKARLKL